MAKSEALAPLRRAFIVAVGAGTVVIGVAGQSKIGQIPVLMAVVAIMIGYSVWVRRRSHLPYGIEQFADSLYYLGFLFTLMALVFNLAPGLSGTSEAPGTVVVLERFGLALVTTIVGLGGRLYFIQFHREISDDEQDAQKLISEAAFKLARELDQSVVYLRDARAKAEQAIVENTEEAVKAIRKVAKSASAAMEKMAETTTDAVTKRTEEIVGMVQSASEESAGAMRDFTKEAIAQTRGIIDDFEKKVEALRLPEDLFAGVRDKLAGVENGVDDLATTVNEHAEASKGFVSRIRESVVGIQDLNEEIKGAMEPVRHIVAAAEATQKLTTSVKTLETSINGYGTEIDKHGANVGEWSRLISQELDSVREYRNQIQQAAADAIQANLEVLDNLVANVRLLREEFE